MEKDDCDAVTAIEHDEPSAWSNNLIATEFVCDNSILLAACIDDCVIGWCCARTIGCEAELLRIGVARRYRRQSVGTGLLSALFKILAQLEVASLFLEVRSQNAGALGFYDRLGFTPVGRRINYYSQPNDDALILKKYLFKENIRKFYEECQGSGS